MSSEARNGLKPKYLSTDNDPLFKFHRWIVSLRILDIEEIKSVPEISWSHPFIERLIGTTRREYLDECFFLGERDLLKKLESFTGYDNYRRVHYAHQGLAPIAKAGRAGIERIDLKSWRWKSYCKGMFSVPIAA